MTRDRIRSQRNHTEQKKPRKKKEPKIIKTSTSAQSVYISEMATPLK